MALLGLVALTWFMVGLCLLLRRAEGEPSWRSTVALVFGALFAAYFFTDTSWDAAGNRGADLGPGHAHFAFSENQHDDPGLNVPKLRSPL